MEKIWFAVGFCLLIAYVLKYRKQAAEKKGKKLSNVESRLYVSLFFIGIIAAINIYSISRTEEQKAQKLEKMQAWADSTAQPEPDTFYDDFSNGNINNWLTCNNDSSSILIIKNKLVIDNNTKSTTLNTYRSFNIDTGHDFTIETMASQIMGNHIEGYGIFWGRSDLDIHYGFIFYENHGIFSIIESSPQRTTYIKKWIHYKFIDNPEGNKLVINKRGNTLFFYINGQLVNTETFTYLFGNNFGMTTVQGGAFTRERIVDFKYFKVTGTFKK